MVVFMIFMYNNRWYFKFYKVEVRVVVKEEVKVVVKEEVKEVFKVVFMICMFNNSNKCRLDNKEDNMVSNSSNSNNKVVNNNNSNNKVVINSNSSNNSRVVRGDSKV